MFLLDHLEDCLGPGGAAGNHTNGEPLGFALTSSMADHPSVIELCRCLDVLRAKVPRHHLHLRIYFGSGWRVVWEPKRSGNGKTVMRIDEVTGRRVPDTVPRRVRAIPAWLAAERKDRETGEPRLVAHAIDMVSALFRGEVYVPDQLRDAAGLTPERGLERAA